MANHLELLLLIFGFALPRIFEHFWRTKLWNTWEPYDDIESFSHRNDGLKNCEFLMKAEFLKFHIFSCATCINCERKIVPIWQKREMISTSQKDGNIIEPTKLSELTKSKNNRSITNALLNIHIKSWIYRLIGFLPQGDTYESRQILARDTEQKKCYWHDPDGRTHK